MTLKINRNNENKNAIRTSKMGKANCIKMMIKTWLQANTT
jgi:hypothetical protein